MTIQYAPTCNYNANTKKYTKTRKVIIQLVSNTNGTAYCTDMASIRKGYWVVMVKGITTGKTELTT